jgi:hypothetical protein
MTKIQIQTFEKWIIVKNGLAIITVESERFTKFGGYVIEEVIFVGPLSRRHSHSDYFEFSLVFLTAW